MNAYFLVYAVVAIGIAVCFINDQRLRRVAQLAFFLIVLVALTSFAGFRSSSVDRDFQDYAAWFDLIQSGAAPLFAWVRDPAFAGLSYIVSRAGLSFSVVASIYALAGITATWILAASISLERWVTLLFYLLFCQFYIVWDMTEIRAAVAIPLMAWSLYLACKRCRLQATIVFLLALIVHFSAIMGLPLLILLCAGVRFRSRAWLITIAAGGVVAALAMGSVINLLSGLYRISEYLNGGAEEHDLRVISWYALAHLVAIVIAMFFWKRLSLHQRMAVIACGFGLTLFLVFGWNTGLATRFLYIFDIYWLLIMLTPVEHLKSELQVLYVGALFIVGFALYCKSLQYVEPYTIIRKWDAFVVFTNHGITWLKLPV